MVIYSQYEEFTESIGDFFLGCNFDVFWGLSTILKCLCNMEDWDSTINKGTLENINIKDNDSIY